MHGHGFLGINLTLPHKVLAVGLASPGSTPPRATRPR